MKKILISALVFILLIIPAVVSAQILPGLAPQPDTTYVDSWILRIITWANRAVTFLMVVATLFFIYSVIRFIMDKGEDPKATTTKKNSMLRGIIGLAVIVGIWGIVRILTSTFGTGQGGSVPVTCPPGQYYVNSSIGCQ